MATDLDRINSLQAIADSTGLIYDRVVSPEKVIGQAWLISRGRVVTLASTVSNYADAPWALIIKFPHPNLTFAVRTVTLHPDFNKREARDYYLAQARGTIPPASFDNDIATLALDSDLQVPEPEKVAELNRALSLPFEISPQDMSGTMRGGDCLQILQSALSTGRSGLLTMVDQRNLPFARISVRQTRIVRAHFENLFNEIAMCELVLRKPAGNFAFQPNDNYRWPADVPEIATPTDNIMAEAQRRADELPRVIEMLGGPDVRFQKITKLADFNSINPSDRWVAERIWEVVDGYLPLGKIPEGAGCDTYSTIKMIWDLATMGLITVNQAQPFHNSGQLGQLLLPAQELEISTWDPLTAMYLDPISGGPATLAGNFFGSAHVLNNKSLLHTVPMPANVPSAAIFKEGKLVGIHSGASNVRGGNMPPIALQRMIWIGALNDIGTKRLRTTEIAADINELADVPLDPQTTSARFTNLRNRPATTEPGKNMTAAPEYLEEEETGPLAKFSKQQIVMASGAVAALSVVMMLGSMMMPHSAPPAANPNQQQVAPVEQPKPVIAPLPGNPEIGDQTAKDIAEKFANFTGNPPTTFKYVDTMKKTEPRESFGLVSELKNTDILFVHWPNVAPMQNIQVVSKVLPIYNLGRWNDHDQYKGTTQNTTWVGGQYLDQPTQTKDNWVVGVFPSADPTRCVVFVGKGVAKGTAIPDMAYPARVVEEMLHKKPAAATAPTGQTGTPAAATTELATPEQLADYRKKIAGLIKANYKQPRTVEEDADTRVGMSFTVDDTGAIKDLVIKPNSDEEFNKAIQKAIESATPLPPPPNVKGGKYSVLVVAEDNKVTVEEQ